MEIDHEGRFRTKESSTVAWIKSSKTASEGIEIWFNIADRWNDQTQEWEDLSQYFYVAKANIWIVKTDGSLNDNDMTKRQTEAIGWAGDPDQCRNMTIPPVQITVKEETWQPPKGSHRTTFKVGFIDPYDSSGGGVRNAAGDEAIAKTKERFGSRLRAAFGKAPGGGSTPFAASPGPAPPQSTPPTAPATPTLPPPEVPGGRATKAGAWEALWQAAQANDPPLNQSGAIALWQAKFGELFQGKPEGQLTPEDWYKLQVSAIASIPPF